MATSVPIIRPRPRSAGAEGAARLLWPLGNLPGAPSGLAAKNRAVRKAARVRKGCFDGNIAPLTGLWLLPCNYHEVILYITVRIYIPFQVLRVTG